MVRTLPDNGSRLHAEKVTLCEEEALGRKKIAPSEKEGAWKGNALLSKSKIKREESHSPGRGNPLSTSEKK